MKVLFGSIMAIALAAALIGCSLGFGPDDLLPEGNIILFIGDGMGFAHVQAASRFHHGTDTGLSFQQFSVQTEMTTHAFGGVVTDSAAAATALATGRKVINGVISSSLLGGEYETILEYCMKFGKSGGLVTTTHITHATPAAFGAHTTSRGNYTDIASDYLHGSRPQVLLGGGGKGMDEASASAAGYTVVINAAELASADPAVVERLSGQFGDGHMPYAYDGMGTLPDLKTMTMKALELLSKDEDGFFLMVESGRIDHASHGNDLRRAVEEVLELDAAVQAALEWAAGRGDTTILVTADHETGGLGLDLAVTPGVLPADDSGIWSTGGHTGVPVPLFVWGVGASRFAALQLDNTDIPNILEPISKCFAFLKLAFEVCISNN